MVWFSRFRLLDFLFRQPYKTSSLPSAENMQVVMDFYGEDGKILDANPFCGSKLWKFEARIYQDGKEDIYRSPLISDGIENNNMPEIPDSPQSRQTCDSPQNSPQGVVSYADSDLRENPDSPQSSELNMDPFYEEDVLVDFIEHLLSKVKQKPVVYFIFHPEDHDNQFRWKFLLEIHCLDKLIKAKYVNLRYYIAFLHQLDEQVNYQEYLEPNQDTEGWKLIEKLPCHSVVENIQKIHPDPTNRNVLNDTFLFESKF